MLEYIQKIFFDLLQIKIIALMDWLRINITKI